MGRGQPTYEPVLVIAETDRIATMSRRAVAALHVTCKVVRTLDRKTESLVRAGCVRVALLEAAPTQPETDRRLQDLRAMQPRLQVIVLGGCDAAGPEFTTPPPA